MGRPAPRAGRLNAAPVAAPRAEIVSIGEATIELNQRWPDVPEYLKGFGGATSNAIVAAARQGKRTACVTRLGNDAFGDRLMALWRAEGIATDAWTRDLRAPTWSAKFLHVSGISQAIGTGASDTAFAAIAMAQPAGVRIATAQGRSLVPGRVVDPVDATGAGDCFAGALLARLAADDAMPAALDCANASAAALTSTS